jgi:hypothetical protein
MATFSKSRCESAIFRLSARVAEAWARENSAEYMTLSCDQKYLLMKRVFEPKAVAKLARRLWVRGHDIEDVPCPCSAFRITSGRVVFQ